MSLDIFLVNILTQPAGFNWLIDYMAVIMAKFLPLLIVIGIFVFGWRIVNWRQRISFFALASSSLLISWGVIAKTIEHFYIRLKPAEVLESITALIHSNPASFPSTHAVILFTLSTSVFIFNRKWGTIFGLLSFLVVMSRIFAGVHWVSDVVAGILIGILIPYLINFFLAPSSTEAGIQKKDPSA